MGGRPAGISEDEWKPERILVIVSDNEWKLNGLKDSNGQPVQKETITSQVEASYDRIYTAMGSEKYDPYGPLPSSQFTKKPTQKSVWFNSG